ncbi:MAG: CvpA family protein [Ferruginibacter sp.]
MLIDIIFLILMALACIKGFKKGLIVAVFSIVAFIVGLAAALKLSAVVAGYLNNSMNVSAKWLPVLSFLLVFFIVVLLVRWGASLIEKTFEIALLGWANRLGGMLFFAVLYIIIFSIVLFYAEAVKLLQPSVISSSVTYAFIKPWGPKVIDGFGKIIPFFKDSFTDLENFFSNLSVRLQH